MYIREKTNLKKTFTFIILFFIFLSGYSQLKKITGVISDSSSPLPGAVVYIKAKKIIGTESDFDGKYSINAKNGDVLVFSYLGYVTKEITVGAKNIINVLLEEDQYIISCYVVPRKSVFKYKYTNKYFRNGLAADINWFSKFDLNLTYKGFNKNNYLFNSKFTLKEKFLVERYFNFGFEYTDIKVNQLNFNFNSYNFVIDSFFDLGLSFSTKFIVKIGSYQINTVNSLGLGFGIKQYIIPKLYIYTQNNYWSNSNENQLEIGYNFNRIHTSITYHNIMNYKTFSYNLGYSIYF